MTRPAEVLTSQEVFAFAVELLEDAAGLPADTVAVQTRDALLRLDERTVRRVAAVLVVAALNRQTGESVDAWLLRLRLEQAVQQS